MLVLLPVAKRRVLLTDLPDDSFDDDTDMNESNIPRQSDCARFGLDAGADADGAAACVCARLLADSEAPPPAAAAAEAVRVVEAAILRW